VALSFCFLGGRPCSFEPDTPVMVKSLACQKEGIVKKAKSTAVKDWLYSIFLFTKVKIQYNDYYFPF
jgi:hypothetical protein